MQLRARDPREYLGADDVVDAGDGQVAPLAHAHAHAHACSITTMSHSWPRRFEYVRYEIAHSVDA